MRNSITQQTSNLQSAWIKHLRTDQEKQDFVKLVLNNSDHPVLKRLFLILEDKLDSINKTQTKSNYASPSWAYLLAHTNGERQMLQEVLDLLSFINGPKK